MDTGTHIVMGVGIAGIATLDPAVANDSTLFQAVFVGTIIGSHVPDFDTVMKLKDNASYIRHHRGETHSIPAVILWGILLAGIIYAIVPEVSFLHLWGWIFLAVALHVLVDIFNAYGTQAIKPFKNKWIALGFINTFDPYIFTLHIVGIGAWILGANPGYTWLIIYVIIGLYYVKRYLDKAEIIKKIRTHFPGTEKIATSPTIKQNIWRVAITTTDKFYVGTVEHGHIEIVDTFEKEPLPNTDMMNVAKEDKNISAFLSFSPVYRWEVNEFSDVTEVRFIDLRYRARGHYPFIAVVQINQELEVVSSYTGWIYSERKLNRKLSIGDNPV